MTGGEKENKKRKGLNNLSNSDIKKNLSVFLSCQTHSCPMFGRDEKQKERNVDLIHVSSYLCPIRISSIYNMTCV